MKVSYARKSLFREKTRFIISLLGVSFSLILILVLLGIYQGFISASKRYIQNSGADIWVAQEGIEDLFHSFSFVPVSLKSDIEKINGVEKVSSLVIRRIVIDIKGEQENLDIVGFNQQTKLGGPKNLIKGKSTLKKRQIVIDRQTAVLNDVDLGDQITIEGKKFKIVGITSGQTTGITSYAYIDFDEAQELFNPKGLVNYILVKVARDKRKDVRNRIQDLSIEITTMLANKFAEKNSKFISDTFVPILSAIVGIALIIGMSIVGLITYTIALSKQREYGLLKAIGASNIFLYSTVVQQSVISGLAGFVIGSLLSFVVSAIVQEFIVQINITQISDHFVLVFIIALLMSMVASLVPVKKVASVDPATVFKA